MMSPDSACSKAVENNIKIHFKQKDGFILIEADEEGLTFLGELFDAMAKEPKGSNFQIYPDGPGNSLFDEDSNVGIYILKK